MGVPSAVAAALTEELTPLSEPARLVLEGAAVAGEYLLAPLLDDGQITAPAISDQGGFEIYQPVPELPSYGRFILQLQPQTK